MITRWTSSGRADRLRIVILGVVVRWPLGGMCWSVLHYLKALSDLGHDVYFVEDSGESSWCCYDPSRHTSDTDPTYGLAFATRSFGSVDMGDRWAYYDVHTQRWFGPCADRILEVLKTTDLVLSLGDPNPPRPWFMEIPARAFIDMDPSFTQIRHIMDPASRNLALQHTAFFSFGENIGLNKTAIPDDGFSWIATRHPIFLDAWPETPGRPQGKFTTVMQWESYPVQEYRGICYGLKSDSFGPYLNLPEKTGPILALALAGASAPRELLQRKGWVLVNPLETTRETWTYQDYIQQSKAEFSIAKHGYVVSRSGWFSERSASYLASGRPVLIQETGFSDWLPTGAGIIPFNTPEEALVGIEEINHRYEFHCEAARAIAEEYFDAAKVLPRLIECALSPSPDGGL